MEPPIREKLFRDPVHDQIVFDTGSPQDRVLLALIDTPEVQRLRRIRQLGLAHFVYPGAEHSRFTHSIGVMWIITRIIERFARAYGIDPDQAFPARCAALLHDVGHGPFSHVLERFLDSDHESWTRRIVCSAQSEVHHVLCGYDLALPSAVADLFDHKGQSHFLADLISSQLDADRFDYLIRDSLMTGVKHGVFDLERLIYCLRLDSRRQQVVVTGKDVLTVEKYLQSRYHMFKQVYQHRTVKSAEAMLTALLRRAVALTADGARLASPPDSPFARFLERRGAVEMDDYLALDDATLMTHWQLWSHHHDAILGDLSRRLLRRDLFKTFPVDTEMDGFEGRFGASAALLRRHGYDPDYYLLRLESKDIPYRPFEEGRQMRHAPILVEQADPMAPLQDVRHVSRVAAALAGEGYRQTWLAFPGARGATDLRAEVLKIWNAAG